MEGFGFVGSSGDPATQLDSRLVKSWSETTFDWVICIGSISGSYSHLAGAKLEDILDFFLRRPRFSLVPHFWLVSCSSGTEWKVESRTLPAFALQAVAWAENVANPSRSRHGLRPQRWHLTDVKTHLRMSAIGTKRTSLVALQMPAFGGRADIPRGYYYSMSAEAQTNSTCPIT